MIIIIYDYLQLVGVIYHDYEYRHIIIVPTTYL